MTRCILNHPGCEGMTQGSVGAAGIRWSMICQNCKDTEDDCVNGMLTAQSRLINAVTDQLFSLHPTQPTQPTQELETIA